MFIKNPHGSESIQDMAAAFGLIFGETCGNGHARAGFVGNTFAMKEQLKLQGAKFDGHNKAWVFDGGWDAAKAALENMAA